MDADRDPPEDDSSFAQIRRKYAGVPLRERSSVDTEFQEGSLTDAEFEWWALIEDL